MEGVKPQTGVRWLYRSACRFFSFRVSHVGMCIQYEYGSAARATAHLLQSKLRSGLGITPAVMQPSGQMMTSFVLGLRTDKEPKEVVRE